MLRHLSIKNYATVDGLEVELKPGMTVITGETGAGKSIMLGGLGLALGDRADKTALRPGAGKLEISAEFDTSGLDQARHWLQQQDLDGDEENQCLLRRVVTRDGRSRAYINGASVTLANLKTLGEMLMDIHSQHEHQSLLHRSTHQRLLDEYAVERKLRESLLATWRQWQENYSRLDALSRQAEENSAESQLLRYQLEELEELAIGEQEVAELEAEFRRLNQADDILSAASQALAACSDDESASASSALYRARSSLQSVRDCPQPLSNALEMLESAAIQLEEASTELRAFVEGFEADPERLESVNARLSQLHNTARKHKIKAAQLPELIVQLQQRLGRFAGSDEELESLRARDRELREQYRKQAQAISKQRQVGASKLATAVNDLLNKLGMPHAELTVSLQPSDSADPQRSGLESVEFLVCTNPGQAPQALQKIASGGELSRISLAIQVVTAQTSQVPSLVFDEVDVGIGGGVARVVGELLRQLAEHTQILCVTHQAQVASQGQQHLFVSKRSSVATALTTIIELQGETVIREVARMLGGEDVTAESLAHAEQMVASN